MTTHPVHLLKDKLESKRLELIKSLAAGSADSFVEALQQLTTVQTALEAVREAIESHGARMGWGPEKELK